jgi:cytochrome c553
MRNVLIVTALLAIGLSACGKKEEAQTEAPPAAPAAQAPAPAPAAAPAAVDGAAKFTASCASCHGANGQGMATFPKLVGLTADTVKARLADYKAGKTVGPQSAVMMPIASMLNDAEVEALASHIASFK